MVTTAEVIIIGAGAAGLMAGVTAGEAGLPCLLVERRHRPGLKLLLCGNNRCNISHAGDARDMIAAYGEPVGTFLKTALTAFPPARLRRWFEAAGVPTCLNRDRIYPTSEKADDVLHCFTDRLRELSVPMILNCPVSAVTRLPEGVYQVSCGAVVFTAPRVLLATGGVSYPKTGSVGDGQRFADELGHTVLPLQAGLAGMDNAADWLPRPAANAALPTTRLTITQRGSTLGTTEGNVLVEGNVLRGTAIFDASRMIARHGWTDFELELDVLLDMSLDAAAARLQQTAGRERGLRRFLTAQGLDSAVADSLAAWLEQRGGDASTWAGVLKALPLPIAGIRPVKEAIVTVGGVDLSEINPDTMESRRHPGLYFAGEVMDIDGPTGGYNLHAAFATARLAIQAMTGTAERMEQPAAAAVSRSQVKAGRRGKAKARGATPASGRKEPRRSEPEGRPTRASSSARRRSLPRWETPSTPGGDESWRQRKRGSKGK
jgi:predicted Rossmann fold flavoprotein